MHVSLASQEVNEAEGIASVREAFRLGINFFDTSPFYGNTKSEQVQATLSSSPAAPHAALRVNIPVGLAALG
jgi:L-galactose dehydrogenase